MKVTNTQSMDNTYLPKSGDVVRYNNTLYMVCCYSVSSLKEAHNLVVHDLYVGSTMLFLVDMQTGMAIKLPNSVSKLEAVHNVSLVSDPVSDQPQKVKPVVYRKPVNRQEPVTYVHMRGSKISIDINHYNTNCCK